MTRYEMSKLSEEEKVEVVKRDGEALQYVHEQTYEICLAAVKENGYALQYVHEQTEEICLEAVKQNGYALQYVLNQTPEMCVEAVERRDVALQYVNPEFLTEDGKELRHVHEQTEEICLEAVRQNCQPLQYVRKQHSDTRRGLRISVSGTVGIGKSTLVDNLSKYGFKTYQERFDEDILNLFYEAKIKGYNSSKIEKLSQFHFLGEAIKREVFSEIKDAGVDVVYDRNVNEHHCIFAKMNLSPRDYVTYAGFSEIFLNTLEFKNYDLTILLRCSDDVIVDRIKSRGRECEQDNSQVPYFLRMNSMYNDDTLLDELTAHSDKVIIIDTSDLSAEQTLQTVLKEIEKVKDLYS